jgi:hypothetical protein
MNNGGCLGVAHSTHDLVFVIINYITTDDVTGNVM